MKIKLILASILLSTSALASNCIDLYPSGQELVVPSTIELCNSFYVTRYDKNNRGVVLTSEKLSITSKIGTVNRVNSFHPDERVGKSSPLNKDYRDSKYDRGHMGTCCRLFQCAGNGRYFSVNQHDATGTYH